MQKVVQQLGALVNEYTAKLNSLTETELLHKPSPIKWSKKEILGHLVDSAQNNIQRFVRVQYETQPHITYNQDVWVSVQHYQDYSTKELIRFWQILNNHVCIILQNMPVEMHTRYCNTGKEQDQLYSVAFLAEDYVAHHLHHLGQIF